MYEMKNLPLGLCGAVEVDPADDAFSVGFAVSFDCECRGLNISFKVG